MSMNYSEFRPLLIPSKFDWEIILCFKFAKLSIISLKPLNMLHYLQLIAAAVSIGCNMNIKHTKIPIFFVTSRPKAMLFVLCCWIFCLRNILFFGSPICCFVFDDCLLVSSMIISLLGAAILFLLDTLNSCLVVTSKHSSWDWGQYDEASFIIYKQVGMVT